MNKRGTVSLITLAAKEIDKSNQQAFMEIETIKENLHDIKMYLDENEGLLPNNSEVTVEELLSLVKRCISDAHSISAELSNANNWIKGIIESKK